MDLAELRTAMAENGAAWASLLAGDLDPDVVVVRHREDGSESHAPMGIRLAQAIHHGTDHRSQVCTTLTTLAIEPPEIDVWGYGWQDGRLSEVPAHVLTQPRGGLAGASGSSGAGAEHFAHLGGERFRLAGLTVFAAEKTAVPAPETLPRWVPSFSASACVARLVILAFRLDAGGEDDARGWRVAGRRSRARREMCRHNDRATEQRVVARAVVVCRQAEHRGVRRRLCRNSAVNGPWVADDGDEVGHAGARPRSMYVSWIARQAASACSRSGSSDASGGSWATSVRTSSECFATSASAMTAPPLLANSRPAAAERLDEPVHVVGVDVGRDRGVRDRPGRCARCRAGRT